MPRVLIVAYGNPLRSDDGAAWQAAERWQNKFPSNQLKIHTLHQLGPELAESISRCECVVFIDAAAGSDEAGSIHVKPVSPTDQSGKSSAFCHALSPAAVVALAKQLYNASPQAFCVTVTGATFDHGESLSPRVATALPELIRRVEKLVRSFVPTP